MEEIRIADANTHDSESGITAEILDNSDVDSFSPKPSLSVEIKHSECNNRLQTLKSDYILGGQNPLDSVSFIPPIPKEIDDVELRNEEVMSPPSKNFNGVEFSSGGGESCPTTPSPASEVIEISSASGQTEDLEILSDGETPTDSIFNPFALGPEELVLAPKKKILREIDIPACRQLQFDDCCDLDEKVESVRESSLQLVVSTQVNEMMIEDVVEDNISNGFMTPTSMPLLTGVADTCPDAPTRPVSKSRRLDHSSSRKLEFESHLI